MPHLDPTPLIAAFNAWQRNDLDVPRAAVCETRVECLPEALGELVEVLPEAHRSFMRHACGPEYSTLRAGPALSTIHFDPTDDVLPDASETSAGQDARAQAIRYFGDRPITHVEVTGNDHGGDLRITLRIAYDREASRVFSFLRVSD